MSDRAGKGSRGGSGAKAPEPKQESPFWAGFLSGLTGSVQAQRPQRHPADPAERMEPVRQDREETGRETVFRATDGAAGQPPMDRVDRQRQYIARAIGERAGGERAGGAGRPAVPKTSGAPLPEGVRKQLEPKLGADLSSARVHTSGESAAAAKGFGARAFTVGDDVHFNSGEFAPGTKEGDKLLAHELTHVVQGQKSGVQRKAEGDEKDGAGGDEAKGAGGDEAKGAGGDEKGDVEVSDPNDPAEKEADEVAERVTGDGEKDEKKGGEKGEKKGGEKGDKKGGEKGEKKGGEKDEKKDDKKDGHDKKEAGEAPKAPVSRQIRRKIFRAPTTPGGAGGAAAQEQQASTLWTPVKGNPNNDGDLARALSTLVPQIDGWVTANSQSQVLKTIQSEIQAKVAQAFQQCSDEVKAVNDELTAADDRKKSAELLANDPRWFKWATHALFGLGRTKQHPRLGDVFSHLERARSGTPEATETLVPSCEYSGRVIIVKDGAAWYQSSGQANAVPGSVYKMQGSWMKIWGVQKTPSALKPAEWKPGWIIKQTLANAQEMQGVSAGPMPNIVFKPDGEVGDVNAWIQGKGVQAVSNIDDTVPKGKMNDIRKALGLPPVPGNP